MNAILFAYHEIGAAALEAMLRNNIDVVAIFTHRDDPAEGGWFRSVARLAADHGIPVHAPDDPNHPLWTDQIRDLSPDAIFSSHYRQMIGSQILYICPGRCYNIHASMLPKYRGRCPINWVLVNGETETGVTLHHMTAEADAGDIIAQQSASIADDDTAATLTATLVSATGTMLAAALDPMASNTAPSTPQDGSMARTSPGGGAEAGLSVGLASAPPTITRVEP